MDSQDSGGRRVLRGLRWLAVLFIVALTGCGVLFGKRKPTTYVTPEGYKGAVAQRGPFILDAVYMDDSARGIEGVVRLTWWNVFSVTVQNRSGAEVSIPDSAFTLVDGDGTEHKALSLEEVLGYQSHVLGPLMSYQRRAIRRAFWSTEPIAPGAFAVGYIFFSRKSSLHSCRLILDPNPEKRKDELAALFDIAPPPEPAPVPEAAVPPADTSLVVPPPAEMPEQESPPASVTTEQARPDTASRGQETATPAAGQAAQQESGEQENASQTAPKQPSDVQAGQATPPTE